MDDENYQQVSRKIRELRSQVTDIEKQRDELLAVVVKAAEQIRRCDYTPARSTLLVAIASVKGGAA